MSKKDSFIHNFAKHKLAVVALLILVVEILVVVFAPIVLGLDPVTSDTSAFSAAPGGAHTGWSASMRIWSARRGSAPICRCPAGTAWTRPV